MLRYPSVPHFIAEKNIALFTKHGIFTKEELFSRYEIWLENYYKTINIESNTLAEMIQKQVIPSVYTYVEKLADTAAAKKSVVADVSVASEVALISKQFHTVNTGDIPYELYFIIHYRFPHPLITRYRYPLFYIY